MIDRPTEGDAALHEALCALAERRFDDALAHAERALDAELDRTVPPDERGLVHDRPERSRAWYVVGTARLEQGDRLAAIAALDQAIRLDPHDPIALSNRAIAKRDLGDESGALGDFDRALALSSRYAHARANRARLLARRGELDAADRDYLRLLAVAPTPEHRSEWDAVRVRRGLAHDDAALRDESARVADRSDDPR